MPGSDGYGRDAGPQLLEPHGMIRQVPLRRRRSRVPWIYSVYHAEARDRRDRAHRGRELAAESAAGYAAADDVEEWAGSG